MIVTTIDGEECSVSSCPSILLVDDESEILPEYKEILELSGFSALIEDNPENVLSTVTENPDIRLVVTDLRMARLDGVSLIRALRAAMPPARKLAFIVLTGDPSAATQELDVPVLSKPVDLDALLLAIHAALSDDR